MDVLPHQNTAQTCLMINDVYTIAKSEFNGTQTNFQTGEEKYQEVLI